MKSILKLATVAAAAGLLFSTSAVKADVTTSANATSVTETLVETSWTWTDFGGQVVGWAAGGAAGGAVTCALVTSPGALVGGAVGTLAGAASGGAYYAATQAWQAVFGSANDGNIRAPATALD